MKKLNLIKRLLSYSHEKQKPQRFGRYAVMLLMLLTLGVGQMWGGNAGYVGNNESYFKNYLEYSKDGGSATQFKVAGSGQSDLNLGVVTSLTLTQYGVGMYQNEDNLNGKDYDKFCYWIHQKDDASESWTEVTGNWNDWNRYDWSGTAPDRYRHPGFGNNNLGIDVLEGLGAGEYKLTFYFKHQGNSNWGNAWLFLNNGGSNYNITFTIAPIVTFHANGGTGSDYTQTVTYNTNTALTANTFTKTGYTFAGWATSSGGDVVYADGANVTLTAHTDLYAKWGQQSLTITSHPDYLTTTDKLNLSIEYANIPSGYCYRVKELRTGGYYNSEAHGTYDPISGTGSIMYTSSAYLPLGADRIVLELWNGTPGAKQTVVSNEVAVTVEQGWEVGVQAKTDGVISTAGGTVSPASVSPTAHIGRTITAEAKVGYDFTGWTANTVNITFDDASELSTTVKATAAGTVYANFAKQSGSYSTTFYAGDHGSINAKGTAIAKNGSASVTIGNNEALSATPESAEYVFDHWGTTGSVDVADTYSASTTVTAAAAGGTVTAYYRHVPVLGAVTATPSGQQNYAGSPIDFALSVTSTYMAHPVVVFLVNDGTTTYEVVGAPYGADGSSAAGTIGSDAAYTTVHKATFTASAAKSYTVSAKLYEGLLVENFETANYTTWGDIEGGTFSTVTNPYQQAGNGSSHVKQITPNGADWHTAITRTTTAWNNDYQYIHAKMYYQGGTGLKWKISDSPATELSQTIGSTNTWQDVAFNNSGRVTIAFMFPFVAGQTNTFYIDDIILSNEASMTVKASQAATASFSINWNYTVTLNNNGATSAGTESVNVTYGSATGITDITVPTKTGYTFGGYYTADAGAGTLQINASGVWQNAAYVADGKWNSGSNQTLYAKWTANTYTVQYNANGGTGDAMGNSDLTYNAGALSTNTYTRAGYTFSGWNTEANGSGSSYSDGQTNPNVSATNGATVTLYAQWAARPYKIVYFAMPQGWTNVYAYTWYSSNTSKKNASFAGVQLNNGAAGTGSVIENGVTYYYYKFYTDGLAGDSEGDGTGFNNSPDLWDRVIFANSNSATTEGTDKTKDLNISTGHYYWLNENANSTGTEAAAQWIVKGTFPSHSWDSHYAISFAGESRSGSVLIEGLTASTSYSFKIYLAKGNAEWYKYTGGADASYDADKDITSDIGTELTLRTYNKNNNTFTTATTSYRFNLDVTNTNNPVLTVVPGDDADYSVTVATNGHGSISQGTGSKTIHKYAPTSLTAVAEPGYRFTGWTVDSDHTSYVSFSPNASSATVTVTGVAGASDATITANFSNSGFVYFDRTAVNGTWSGDKVYMTCLNSSNLDWDGTTGTLIVKNWVHDDVHNQEMHRIPNSNIYYFDCTGHLPSKILFTDKTHPHGGGDKYYKLYDMGAVVEWEHVDLSYDNMYVVENHTWQSKNKTGYFEGYWMKYNETSSGIELQVFDEAQKAIAGSPVTFTTTRAGDRQFEASISLSAATAYLFKVKGFNGRWYGNSGTMTNTNCTGWDFLDRVSNNCYFRSTGAGSYKFTLNCTNEGKLKVSLEFPLDVNDYRVVYQGKVKEGGSTTKHPSEFIRHLQAPVVASDTTRKDTISFYVREDWSLQLQKCSAVSPSVTWGDEGDAITKASLGITENGVYTFYVTQTNNGTTNTVTIEKGEEYTGDYYIRSSAAGGGWEAYQTTPDNKLVHSDFSKVHSGYDYYHCHYVSTGQNVKFCIANDYSTNITDTVENDTYVTSSGNLPYECSVRFMYNNDKNTISRAYLNGSYDGSTEYLALYSKAGADTDSIKNIDNSAIDKAGGINHVKFQDMGNWVYQKDIKALPGTRVRLISNYRFSNTDHLQYFKGSAGDWDASTTEQLIGGTTNDWQKLRLVYDFKTNHLIGAWLVPDGDIREGGLIINADVMIIRTDQGDAEQITFGDPKDKLDKVNVIYSTLHLTYNHIANKKKTDNTTDSTLTARSQREYYWVSFPYDVKIEDIFGSVGDFNNEWGIMYYDGKERAEKGYWSDSPSFWKYFTDRSATLKAFEGYVVGVDIDMVGQAVNKGKWVNGVRDVYLYFPSDTVKSIVNRDTTITIDQEGYECTIDRRTDKSVANVDKDRRIADSYWHCIGVPSFHDVSHKIKDNWTDPGTGRDVKIPYISDWETPDVPYLYEWDPAGNSYTPKAATTYNFKAMYSYIVQYNRDNIKWSAIAAPEAPAAIAARKVRMMENGDIEWRIDLMRDDESQDRTYVRMSNDESVTSGFEFSYDLTKELNANKANIYTFADYVPVAGNVMPMSTSETTIVPVGVKIPANGLYAFTMPEGSNGVGIYLVDNIAGTRTNLGLTEYTVNLTAGKYDQRFFLEISPIAQAPTDIEQNGANVQKGVRKVMVDGVLYIVKDGVVFDAQGRKIE